MGVTGASFVIHYKPFPVRPELMLRRWLLENGTTRRTNPEFKGLELASPTPPTFGEAKETGD